MRALDATTGQAIVAYVTLKGGDDGSVEMLEALRNHVATKIGAIAKPGEHCLHARAPKTRSGKIMRRLLRDVAEHDVRSATRRRLPTRPCAPRSPSAAEAPSEE